MYEPKYNKTNEEIKKSIKNIEQNIKYKNSKKLTEDDIAQSYKNIKRGITMPILHDGSGKKEIERKIEYYINAIKCLPNFTNGIITESQIKQINYFVLNNKYESSGYRDAPVEVGAIGGFFYHPPDAEYIPTMMEDLLNWLNNEQQELKAKRKERSEVFSIAGVFHYRFLKIHPFQDGNCRTAMLLTKLILMNEYIEYKEYKEFFQHSSIEYSFRTDYYSYASALSYRDIDNGQIKTINENADLTSWLIYFLKKLEILTVHDISKF